MDNYDISDIQFSDIIHRFISTFRLNSAVSAVIITTLLFALIAGSQSNGSL